MKNNRVVLIILLVAFIIYAAIGLFLPKRTFWPDESRFVGEAISIATTGEFTVFGEYRAWEMPLTAIIYSVFYNFFGEHNFIAAIRIFQAMILILTSLGVGQISKFLFKDKIAYLAAIIMTLFYPSLVAYHITLLSELFFIFFLVWSFAFIYLWMENKKIMWLILSIITFSLAAYTRATLTFVIPVFVLLAAYGANMNFSKILRYTLISAIVFTVCLSPWWIRNYGIFGKFIPFTTSASWNLYLGNNPVNTTASIDWGISAVDQDEVKRIFDLKDELEISNAFTQKSKEYITNNPGVFLRNAWLKFKRFWNFTSNYDAPTEQSLFFRMYNISLLLSWLPVFCLGIASFWFNRKTWKKILPIYCLIAYYTFIHVVVIASLRYRLPIEPFFIIMVSDCIGRIVKKFIQTEQYKLLEGKWGAWIRTQ